MKKRWIWLTIVVAVIVVVSLFSAAGPDARVLVINPHSGTLLAYVEEQAVTELPHDYLMSMPISGWLERIDLREGDAIEEGQVVARLDTGDLADRVRQAQQRIAVLETRIKQTADHRLENNMLVETKATVKAFDETVRASEAKLEAALAVLEFAQMEVERLKKASEAEAVADRELRAAETAWRKAKAEYQSDALELAALKTLAAVSYIGPKFMTDYIDRKSFDLSRFSQQLEEARAGLEIERRNLGRAQVQSPIDGVVLARHQTRRQYLQAGTPLVTVGRLDDMEIIAELLTERAIRVSPGDPVDIYGEAITDGPIRGTVLRVYPAGFKKISSLGVEQQRVKVAIGLEDRPPALGVAFRVHVRVFYDQADDALILPRTAIFRGRDGGWEVMTVDDGICRQQTVKLGLTNDDDAQILEGVTTNDLVVARPARDIVPGMRVEIVR